MSLSKFVPLTISRVFTCPALPSHVKALPSMETPFSSMPGVVSLTQSCAWKWVRVSSLETWNTPYLHCQELENKEESKHDDDDEKITSAALPQMTSNRSASSYSEMSIGTCQPVGPIAK